MKHESKELRNVYDLIVRNLNASIDEWATLRNHGKDHKTEINNFEDKGYSITKCFIAKEVKMIAVITTLKFKLKLEIFESLTSDSRKKIVVFKYGGVMSSMENMMFEQYSYRVGRRTIQKGVMKMVKHLVKIKFIT